MIARHVLRFGFALSLFVTGTVVSAQERIISFHSDITVNSDASINVLETIQVYADGDKIKRGIYREFAEPFPVTRIERNGRPENHHFGLDNGKRQLYFGSEDVILSPGVYTYTLEYHVVREIRDIDTHDEVYWNVTGNEWDFTIESASARVILPNGINANELGLEAYTGGMGAKGQDYIAEINPNGEASYQSTRPLIAGEGLTIVTTFPKGFVKHPPLYSRIVPRSFLMGGSWVALISPLLLLVYFTVAWMMVGRDPVKGRILPVEHPPRELSAAACHYIQNMAYDQKAFTVTLISMAIKGAMQIKTYTEKVNKIVPQAKYSISRIEEGEAALNAEEAQVYDALFADKDELMLSQSNQKYFAAGQKALWDTLKSTYGTGYFNRNGRYFGVGLLLMYALLFRSGYLYGASTFWVSIFLTLWLSAWTVGVIALWLASFGFARKSNLPAAIALAVVAMFFSLFEVFGIGMLIGLVSLPFAIALLIDTVLLYVFARLIKAPTRKGRVILDQLEGFRAFLRGEGQHRFAKGAEESFEEVYERYLPYAMVVGEEQDWSNAFESALTQSTRKDRTQVHYTPTWYHSSDSFEGASFDIGSFGTSLSSAFSSAVNSSSTSSSSGSGGGGSSGGGGGGGGGGGW